MFSGFFVPSILVALHQNPINLVVLYNYCPRMACPCNSDRFFGSQLGKDMCLHCPDGLPKKEVPIKFFSFTGSWEWLYWATYCSCHFET